MKIYQPRENILFYNASALDVYQNWEPPITIISDGAYGVGGFPGDPATVSGLGDWYRPHIEAWAEASTPRTTLWFWNTELGWATVHPVLEEMGWKYISCNIWDKGISHVAGNSNTQTLRHFPKVTEVCVQYVREPYVVQKIKGHKITFQDWLISEWKRSGLPFSEANAACKVKNAASRKYLTSGPEWYPPPPAMLDKMAKYLSAYGDPAGLPYLDLDSVNNLEGNWNEIRSTFNCPMGVTNVWKCPSPRGKNRFQYGDVTHPNQKPLQLIERIIKSSTNADDVVWEPFAGTAPAAMVSSSLNRKYFGAELNDEFFSLSKTRIANEIFDCTEESHIKVEGLLKSFITE